jgi:hypothetical protein
MCSKASFAGSVWERSGQKPHKSVPGAIFLGIKRPGIEADHTPSSSAKIKSDGVIPPLPYVPTHLHAVVLN